MFNMEGRTKYKLEGRDSVWFHENSGDTVVKYAKEVCDVAILPIGAIEQHGPHCPNGSDTFNAIGIAEKVAEKSGAMLLPCPMYGSHPHHHWGMPGTIPLTYQTHIALLKDIIRGAAVAGYNKFIIISAHGQVSSMIVATHELGIEGYFTLSSTWYDFLRDNKEELDDFMWHADEAETSLALHLYPEHVNMEYAVAGGGTPLMGPEWKAAPGQALEAGMMYHFEGTWALPEKDDLEVGVIGDPTKATAEKGKVLVDKTVNHYCRLIGEIRERYPNDVNPLGFRNPLGYQGAANIQYDSHHDNKGQLIRSEVEKLKTKRA